MALIFMDEGKKQFMRSGRSIIEKAYMMPLLVCPNNGELTAHLLMWGLLMIKL
uniref:Uncharacterized protein n=1 Tax=Rhizophora mucronata TaxID=61149 RepID=A0A2P2IUP3_RHIMU